MRNEDEDGKGLYANGAAFHMVSHGQRPPISITVMNRFLSLRASSPSSPPRSVIDHIFQELIGATSKLVPINRVATGIFPRDKVKIDDEGKEKCRRLSPEPTIQRITRENNNRAGGKKSIGLEKRKRAFVLSPR